MVGGATELPWWVGLVDYYGGRGYWITMLGRATGLPWWAGLLNYDGGRG